MSVRTVRNIFFNKYMMLLYTKLCLLNEKENL